MALAGLGGGGRGEVGEDGLPRGGRPRHEPQLHLVAGALVVEVVVVLVHGLLFDEHRTAEAAIPADPAARGARAAQ